MEIKVNFLDKLRLEAKFDYCEVIELGFKPKLIEKVDLDFHAIPSKMGALALRANYLPSY